MLVSRNQPYETVDEFIQAQELIRIDIPDSSSDSPGLGNMAVARHLVDYLKYSKKYKGKFECIVPKGAESKVATIFGLRNNFLESKEPYYDSENKIRFIGLNEFEHLFEKNKVEPCVLSFSSQLISLNCNGIFCDNNAKGLNSFIDISIQSYLNDIPHIYQNNVCCKSVPLKSACTFFKNHIGTTQEFLQSLGNEPIENSIFTKKPGFGIFVEGLRENNFNAVLAYGWPLLNWREDQHLFPNRTLELLVSIDYMMKKGSAELTNKPVILAVFYEYTKEQNEIKNIIDSSKEPKLANLKEKIIYANIENIDSIEQINNLATGKIMLLSVGKISQKYFNFLFTLDADNILGTFFEGESTRNLLTSRPDRPYYPYINLRTFITDICADKKIYPELSELYYLLEQKYYYTDDNIVENGEKIGTFLINYRNESSIERKYFKQLSVEANKPENNKLELSLEKAKELYNQSVYDQQNLVTSSATRTKSPVTIESLQMVINAVVDDISNQMDAKEDIDAVNKDISGSWFQPIDNIANQAGSWFYKLLSGSNYFYTDSNSYIWNPPLNQAAHYRHNQNVLFTTRSIPAISANNNTISNNHSLVNKL